MLAQVNHMLAKRELRCFANWKCCADCSVNETKQKRKKSFRHIIITGWSFNFALRDKSQEIFDIRAVLDSRHASPCDSGDLRTGFFSAKPPDEFDESINFCAARKGETFVLLLSPITKLQKMKMRSD